MQKSKKRILGAAGLALVAGATVVAYNIKTPSAYAETSSDVQLKVTVYSNNLSISIGGNLPGGSTSKDSVTVPIYATDISKLDYKLIASQPGRGTVVSVEGSETLSTDPAGFTGTYDLPLALKNYKTDLVNNHGYDPNADITFSLYLTGHNYGGAIVEDGMSFTYGNITIDPSDNIDPNAPEDQTNVPTDDNGDPQITIETGDNVDKIHVVVRDPSTGEVVWEGDVPNTNPITIPFAENGITSGNYTIEIYAYDANGTLIGSSSLDIRYVRPDGLPVPNTGGISIAGLNIAKPDFLISSALVFFLVGLGGIYLIHRKQTRK